MKCINEKCPVYKNDLCTDNKFAEENMGECRICDTYGCDICGCRADFKEQVVWITTSYGICRDCYDKLSEEEIEEIETKFE